MTDSGSVSSLTLAGEINRLLRDRTDITLAAAESCTGGSVARALTAFAGSSNYVLGSIVSYVNRAKAELLGVPETILAKRGAVSTECAIAMAEGARRVFHADIAVSTTGIAGPGGATERKPVGLVYTAIASADGTMSMEYHFSGDRLAVTEAATQAALQSLLDSVTSAIAASPSN